MYKAQCPTCLEEAADNQLRNNRIIDDVIEIFVTLLDEVRSFMQEYGKISEPPKKLNNIPDLHQKSYNSDSRVKYNAVDKGIVNSVCSNQRETGAYRKLSECATGPAESSGVPKSEVELSDYSNFVRLQNMTPVKESHQSPDHRRKGYKSDMVIPAMFSPRKKQNVAGKFVSCPVCNVDIPERNINVHLDACLKRSENFDQHK
jgi:E3 ubiquitin-protein ligase RAD18